MAMSRIIPAALAALDILVVLTSVLLGEELLSTHLASLETSRAMAMDRRHMAEAVALEKDFIRDCLPANAVGLRADDFLTYIDYIADRRLEGCGLPILSPGAKNPLPWLAEMMDIKKEQNFFEGRVTEYQKQGALGTVNDDEL